MKLLAAAGLLIALAFVVAGGALKGGESVFVCALAGVGSLFCALRLLAPSSQSASESPGAYADRAFLAKIILWAFLLRAGASIILHTTDLWRSIAPDEDTFDGNGQVFYLYLRGDLVFRIGDRLGVRDEWLYPYILGALYYTYGVSKFLPLLMNCAFGAAVIYPVHALAGRLGGRAAARRAALLVAFFPALVLWSTVMVRDVWALLCIAGALHFAERIRRRFSPADFLGLVSCCGLMGLFRSYIMFVLVGAIVGAWLLGGMTMPKAAIAGGLVMFGLILALRSGAVSSAVLEGANLDNLAVMRHNNSLGSTGAGSLGTADISTPTAALTYLPLGLLYFYCSPLPWQIGSLRQVIALADVLLWYSCLPAIFFGFAWLLRHRFRATLPLLFSVIGISVLYALVEGNIGIIFRHRAQIVVPLCAVAGVGYALKQRARRKESRAREGPVPLDAADRSPFRPPEDLRLPARSP